MSVPALNKGRWIAAIDHPAQPMRMRARCRAGVDVGAMCFFHERWVGTRMLDRFDVMVFGPFKKDVQEFLCNTVATMTPINVHPAEFVFAT